MSEQIYTELIRELLDKPFSKETIHQKKLHFSKKYHLTKVPTDIELLLQATPAQRKRLTSLNSKPIRTGSGVAPVALMAKPWPCPHGRCTYCPGGIGSPFGDVPQSYTGHEPNPRRAARNNYDAFLQVINRLEQYVLNGYLPDKADIILMGGTFLAYPKDYQDQFIIDIYCAMNAFSDLFFTNGTLNLPTFREILELPGDLTDVARTKRIHAKLLALKPRYLTSLEEAQTINETAIIRCIGLTIETKPDWGLLDHANIMLRYGTTKVELGVQTLNDKVLTTTHRGHTLADTHQSIKTLRDLGFKLNFHMMPGQPGSTQEQDLKELQTLFTDDHYKPDMLKIYPCMVIKGTALYKHHQAGTFTPLTTEQAATLIAEAKRTIPPYCRIMRVQRDIPTNVTEEGVDRTNLRQYVDKICVSKGIRCKCIRCRELRTISTPIQANQLDYQTETYTAAGGREYFISANQNDQLVGFVRLRFPGQYLRKEITPDSALIRELHVYGPAVPIGDPGTIQHRGVGKKLMHLAETIAKDHAKTKMVVISGVGVRAYFARLDYKKEGPYMVKHLC